MYKLKEKNSQGPSCHTVEPLRRPFYRLDLDCLKIPPNLVGAERLNQGIQDKICFLLRLGWNSRHFL